MPEFPTGVVTLVFTDIEGSSALWEAHNRAFSPVLEAHNQLMRAAASQFNGCEVKTEGDAFFLAFAKAEDAVRFALAAQLSLAAFDWNALLPGLLELRVRIGMHTGEPILSAHPDGTADYFGPVVNRAARVGSAGYGGQILVSDAIRNLASDAEVGFENLGRHRLKGVGDEVLWQVTHEGLPDRFPALKTLGGMKHNLPPEQTPFIGRETEIREWSDLLRNPANRLLTLCGFGGQGKTRLALQIGENLVEDFADGVWWVELEEARDAESMLSRIAHELRLHLQPQPSIRDQLHDFLRERQLLLVLDNTEQLLDAGRVINDLLGIAPRLQCLVTTRRALEIRAERVVTVHPLPLFQSVTLFVERAQSRNPEFTLSRENQGDVEELCRALEGVPLAIELAASRLAVLSPREILDRLDERFRVLQSRAPDLPPRQKALRGAIDWSFDLLTDEAKTLLGALSVFSGGFTLDAVEKVSDDFEALEGLVELRRHSFLRSEEVSGQKRFSMLESVRAYAAEKLRDQPNSEAVQNRHSHYFLQFARRSTQKLRTKDEARTLDSFWYERANISAALDRFLARQEAVPGAQLAQALYELLFRLGFWEEARNALEKGLKALQDAPNETSLHDALQLRLASVAHDLGQIVEAKKLAQDVLDSARTENDPINQAEASNLLGLLAMDAREYDAAQEFFELSLHLRSAQDDNGRAVGLNNLAILANRLGNAIKAQELYVAALNHRRRGGNLRGEAETLGNMGVLAFNNGDFEEARQLYEQSLVVRRKLRDRFGIGVMLHNLGEVAVVSEDFNVAVSSFVQSQQLFEEVGHAFAAASADELEKLRLRLGMEYEAVFEQAQKVVTEEEQALS